jgi:hypothetical protein
MARRKGRLPPVYNPPTKWRGGRGARAAALYYAREDDAPSGPVSAWEAILDSLKKEDAGMVIYGLDPVYPRILIRDTVNPVNNFNGNLNDKTVYTAPSPKKVMGPTGLVKYANHNLFTYSAEFDNAAWDKTTLVTIAPNAIAAPDGTLTADFMVPTVTNIPHRISRIAYPNGSARISVFAKAGSYYRMGFCEGAQSALSSAMVDLRDGSQVSGAGSTGTTTAVDMGNGWWKVTWDWPTAPALADAFGIAVVPNNAPSSWNINGDPWVGDGVSGLYIWGAELKASPVHDDGSLAQYVPTTSAARYMLPVDYETIPQRTNQCTYSQDFTNPIWQAVSLGSVTGNYALAPDGTHTAGRGFANTGVQQLAAAAGGATYTFSIWVKTNTGVNQNFALKLTHAGVVDNQSPAKTATTSWQRFEYTATFGAGGNGAFVGVFSVGGDIDLQIWGAQLEVGGSASPYIPTTTAAVTRPISFAIAGLLIEEARTNHLLWSEDISNAIWTGSNVSFGYNLAVAPDGTTTADEIAFPAIVGAGDFGLFQQQAVTGNTSVKTGSIYLKAKTAGDVGKKIWLYFDDGSFKDLVAYTLTADWGRAATAGLTATTNPQFKIGVLGTSFGGQAQGAVNVHVWGAQCEAGAFASSYIKTTTAAVTRAADNISLKTAKFRWSDDALAVVTQHRFANAAQPGAFGGALWSVIDDVDSVAVSDIHIRKGSASYLFYGQTNGGIAWSITLGNSDLAGIEASTAVNKLGVTAGEPPAVARFVINGVEAATSDNTAYVADGLDTLHIGVRTPPTELMIGQMWLGYLKHVPRVYSAAELALDTAA